MLNSWNSNALYANFGNSCCLWVLYSQPKSLTLSPPPPHPPHHTHTELRVSSNLGKFLGFQALLCLCRASDRRIFQKTGRIEWTMTLNISSNSTNLEKKKDTLTSVEEHDPTLWTIPWGIRMMGLKLGVGFLSSNIGMILIHYWQVTSQKLLYIFFTNLQSTVHKHTYFTASLQTLEMIPISLLYDMYIHIYTYIHIYIDLINLSITMTWWHETYGWKAE